MKTKVKRLLESSIDCALLAVEVYNKPRATFRVECYITQMIMAWTKLLHAYFQDKIGERYFFKKKNGRYETIDGERKAWDLSKSIKEYGELTEPVKSNLDFFIKLRNKIEHRIVDKEQIGLLIFGECQSMLYNYERELVKLFGNDYALNENLAYSLQFSTIRTKEQIKASRSMLSPEIKELKSFIDTYRTSLAEEVFNSQDFSIKLIQIPRISNTNRSDLAIEFVNWTSLSEDDKTNYEKVTVIIKDKLKQREAVNPGKLKPGDVLKQVNEHIRIRLSHYDHKCLLSVLCIRPFLEFKGVQDPYQTNTMYCHYDETHNDYVYQDAWVSFLVEKINTGVLTKDMWVSKFKNKETIVIEDL